MSRPDFADLVRLLSQPDAYPDPVQDVTCIQTHISAVFLAGDRAYKVKKPRDLGFLDFTTPERRRHFCHEEVRLNRRLAPAVYEGVVPIVRTRGGVQFGGHLQEPGEPASEGAVLDWAVRMVRLPEGRTFESLLGRGKIGTPEVRRLAEHVARFHAVAERGMRISAMAGWGTLLENERENFAQLEPFVGSSVGPTAFARLRDLSSRELARHRELIERRAEREIPRDTHGDLRLAHVYLLSAREPGASGEVAEEGETFVIIDCIEFNERFRWADPVADIAFLVMELEFQDCTALASELGCRYLEAAADGEGRNLLPYFTSYRDIVRGKVRSLEAAETDVPAEIRAHAGGKATRHLLRALGRLAGADLRPALVVIFGLPGVGKSTLARDLSTAGGFDWLDTDRVRKELAAAERAPAGAVKAAFEDGIYTPSWTARTYDECLRRARAILFDGGRVLVEGMFAREDQRRSFLDLAWALGVPVLLLHCTVGHGEAKRRLEARSGDVSDADWDIHQRAAARWEAFSPETASHVRPVSLGAADPAIAVERVTAILETAGLVPEGS